MGESGERNAETGKGGTIACGILSGLRFPLSKSSFEKNAAAFKVPSSEF
jgi:hypothetical protein